MEATELRIGNWILNGIGEKFQANGETIGNFMAGQMVLGNFNPIPLTEEWLLKLGFRKMVTQDKHPTFLREGIHWNDGIIYVSQLGFLNHIKSVHQLQNLYHALTGKELTLKT